MSEVTGQANNVKAFKSESFAPTPEVLSAWQAVYKDLRDEFGEAVYRSWLKPLTLQAYYHGTLEVSVPTRFMRDWIQTHYAKRILEMSSARYDDIKRLEIVVVQNAQALDGAAQTQEDEKKAKGNDNKTVTMEDPFDLASPLDARYTFGLSDLNASEGDETKAKNRVLSVMAGWKF